jgi:FkbM family methyltransferase
MRPLEGKCFQPSQRFLSYSHWRQADLAGIRRQNLPGIEMQAPTNNLHRLRKKLANAIEGARNNPFCGLPKWMDESFRAADTPVICCGTGHWAGAFLHFASGIEVLAVVDDGHAGKTVLGHPCIDTNGLIELLEKRPEIVCINTGQSDAGYSHFERLAAERGFKMLNYLQAIRALRLETDIRVGDWLPHIVTSFDEYLALEPLLGDQTSIETLFALLLYHLTTDREHLLSVNRPGEATYFRSGLFELSEREVYADCGSYDGDSVQKFLQVTAGRFKCIHAFEPDPANFGRMQRWLAAEQRFGYASRIDARQQAVGRAAGRITFNQTAGEGACIPKLGEDSKPLVGTADGVEVEVVSLDDAIPEPLSLAKLDVEGHEIEILHGAKRHLLTAKPKLAICAYHLPTDLIALPRFLRSLGVGYSFGLRHHSNTRYDTVLYAF